MIIDIIEILKKVILAAIDILNGASFWLVLSFILAGALHNILSPARFQRVLGNRRFSSIVKATLSGMLLPVCSCGVIPLGIGLYYSGAYLGPTLAFMTATPIINPAAVILAYGLLGPQIATVYLIAGFLAPVLIGSIGNLLAGREIHAPGIENPGELVELESSEAPGLGQKLRSGLNWGFTDLGVQVSKYVVIGMLLAGVITTLVPPVFIQQFLGNPGLISLAGIAVLGAIMYVCAVGHIPFIAALVASGAAPGIAITFLMTGAATNLPELISIYKMIGKRAVAIYTLTLVSVSLLIGYFTNKWLLPEFTPLFDLAKTHQTVSFAYKLIYSAPEPLQYLCSAIVLCLGFYSLWPGIARYLAKERSA